MQKLSDVDFDSIEFYRTSYRELYGIWKNFLIGVYPFAINMYDLENIVYKDGTEPTHVIQYYDDIVPRLFIKHKYFHHQDYIQKRLDCDLDPCDIFEKVYGIKIHNKEDDTHLMNLEYEYFVNDRNELDLSLISYYRNSKLYKLLNNELSTK